MLPKSSISTWAPTVVVIVVVVFYESEGKEAEKRGMSERGETCDSPTFGNNMVFLVSSDHNKHLQNEL